MKRFLLHTTCILSLIVLILAGSKFLQGDKIAPSQFAGFFYAQNDIAVFYPRLMVVMAIESPVKDLDSGKGNAAFLFPELKFHIMSKSETLAEAWARLNAFHGDDSPRQIKNALFNIQNHLLTNLPPDIEDGEELSDHAFHLKLLYDFIDETELIINRPAWQVKNV